MEAGFYCAGVVMALGGVVRIKENKSAKILQ
jgi:hypothetical protein